MTEIQEKLRRLRNILDLRRLDAVLLRRNSNFAWLTCGASGYVHTATDLAAAGLLVTAEECYVLTDNIESTRLEAEETLAELGFQFRVRPWFQPEPGLEDLLAGKQLGADIPYPGAAEMSADLRQLRLQLLPEEDERFRELSRLCADAMQTATQLVRPGMTEFQIAGLLHSETMARGVLPTVNLVATDERIYRFRHPLPTAKRLDRYAMLVLCGRMYGLVASLTRLVHFGRLPDELRQKAEACAVVDATFIHETRPGQRISDVLQAGQAAYAAAGYPDEWQLHHQGGPAGYEPREVVATPDLNEQVLAGQVYAWNPSITGVKSEDTIHVGTGENEIMTAIEGWPTVQVVVNGATWERPAILEVIA